MDKVIKRLAKRWMNLPQRANAEVLFLPSSMGDAGLLPLADIVDVLMIFHAFKILHYKDVDVSALARSTLVAAVSKWLGRAAAEQDRHHLPKGRDLHITIICRESSLELIRFVLVFETTLPLISHCETPCK